GQAHMLYHFQYLQRRSGSIDEAESSARRALDIFELLDDRLGVAAVHQALGVFYREYRDDLAAAAHHLEQALALVGEDTTTREYSSICFSLATVYVRQGRSAEAEPLLAHSLRFARSAKDHDAAAFMLGRLSDIWEPERAFAALAEGLELAKGSRDGLPVIHEAYSRLYERLGRLEDSVTSMRAALAIYQVHNATASVERV